MAPLYRAQVLLEREQYEQLRRLARSRSLRAGRRVSVSQVLRELVAQALEAEDRAKKEAWSALEELIALGEAVRRRHPGELPEDWFERDREEHDDERFGHLFPGG